MSAGALILLLAALALCTRAAAPMVSRTDVAAAQCAAAGFLAAVNQTGFRIRPLWMHAPKTGSAFATTLIQGQPECAQLAFDGPILEPSVKLKVGPGASLLFWVAMRLRACLLKNLSKSLSKIHKLSACRAFS